jgi:hypothetical protein
MLIELLPWDAADVPLEANAQTNGTFHEHVQVLKSIEPVTKGVAGAGNAVESS